MLPTPTSLLPLVRLLYQHIDLSHSTVLDSTVVSTHSTVLDSTVADTRSTMLAGSVSSGISDSVGLACSGKDTVM